MVESIKSFGMVVHRVSPADYEKGNRCPKCGGELITFPVNGSPGDQITDKLVNSLTKCSNYEKQDGFCDYEVENRGLRRYG